MSYINKPKNRPSTPVTLLWGNLKRLPFLFFRSVANSATIDLGSSDSSRTSPTVTDAASRHDPQKHEAESAHSTSSSIVPPSVSPAPSLDQSVSLESLKSFTKDVPGHLNINLTEPTDVTCASSTTLHVNTTKPSFPFLLTDSLSQPSLQSDSPALFISHSSCHDFTEEISRPSSDPVYTGPYSRVYKQEYEGKTFAIKVARSVGTLRTIRRRMRREVETGSRLDHPNVLVISGVIEAEWCQYGCIVTRWCLNGDAAHYVRQKHLGHNERYRLFCGVASGLEYLHQNFIVHGDLKPKNVLIDEYGRPLICDFGLARILDAESRHLEDDINTTTIHTGTVRYLAFELVEPDTPADRTKASDIHALGCVGYELLYLEKPYSSRLNNAGGHIFRDIANGIPPAYRPAHHIPSTECLLWDLLECCWRRNPEERPTISVVHTSLNELSEQTLQSNAEGSTSFMAPCIEEAVGWAGVCSPQ